MTKMTEAEMKRLATENARKAIAAVEARRTTESARIKELAEATIVSRLARSVVTGTTKSGRLITELTGTACAEEIELAGLRR